MGHATVTTGYHDASSYAHSVNGEGCWISWCKVDGKFVDTAERDTEADAAAWRATQVTMRKAG